jgi:hypothetical protein
MSDRSATKPLLSRKKLIAVSFFCVLAGLLLRSCIFSDYEKIKPTKLETVEIPERQIKISLFCKPQPRMGAIAPYAGEYRMVEVTQSGKPAIYFDLPATLPAETLHFEVYWYPTNNIVRFKDSGFTSASAFRSETILDLNKQILFCAIKPGGGRITHLAKFSRAMQQLSFPEEIGDSRVAHTFGETGVGNEQAEPTDAPWTSNDGVPIGVIVPQK